MKYLVFFLEKQLNKRKAALTHTVAALFPKVPQTQHALFTARTVAIRRTTLAQLLESHTHIITWGIST